MTDKLREEFERWVRREGLFVGKDRGLYESHLVGWMWQAWQASRAVGGEKPRPTNKPS